ncbi:N-acetyltransferase [Deferrisoma camini]|uniref:N-acetyltransferase n=1 Tax=Deferrisoma camini TaxID=1035120 RepID=UPI0004B5CF9A|nr:N-acetyltransferase [Deferrisoma camini]
MTITVVPARLQDVEAMKAILDDYAREGVVLSRSRLDLYENLRDFVVAWRGDEIVGLSALHICWVDLGEVRSLAVRRDLQGRGIGRRLVEACLEQARCLGLRRLFALTYRPGFFAKMGFHEVEKSQLPHKVWKDCLHCSKFPECDEVAVMRELGP